MSTDVGLRGVGGRAFANVGLVLRRATTPMSARAKAVRCSGVERAGDPETRAGVPPGAM